MSASVTEDASQDGAPLDRLVGDLRRRRAAAGNPSYAEIAARVTARREAAGLGSHEARVARTTIYDLFREGRKRIDTELLLEVVAALGADPAEVDGWERRCVEALGGSLPDGRVRPSLQLLTLGGPCPGLAPLATPVAVMLMAAAVALNLLGAELTRLLPLDRYLDMVGTSIVAIAVGPWGGAAVGLLTDVGEAFIAHTTHAVWFGLCNVAGALVWGYGVRRGMGRTLPRFIVLNAAAGVVVSLIASPIILAVYDGRTGHGSDTLVERMVADGHGLATSVVWTNLLNSLCDKMLSGFVALAVAEWLIHRPGGPSVPSGPESSADEQP